MTNPSADETRLANIRRCWTNEKADPIPFPVDNEPVEPFLLRLLDASRARLTEEHDHFLQAVADGIAVSKRASAAEERASALAPLVPALRGMLDEWDRLTKYGSPMAKAANPRVAAARSALAQAEDNTTAAETNPAASQSRP